MRAYLFFTTILLVAAAPAFARAEEKKKADSRAKLETAIPDAIRMLKARQYTPFLKKFVAPDDLKKVLKKVSLEKLTMSFQEKKAQRLLKILSAVKTLQPGYNQEKTKATYKLEKKIGRRDSISFRKVGKLWYIQN